MGEAGKGAATAFVANGRGWQGAAEDRSERPRMVVSEDHRRATPPSSFHRDSRKSRLSTYIMTRPPSTANTCPVMKAASSLARNATAFAISSVVPNRPSGVAAVICA
jgi:hypothetical protein